MFRASKESATTIFAKSSACSRLPEVATVTTTVMADGGSLAMTADGDSLATTADGDSLAMPADGDSLATMTEGGVVLGTTITTLPGAPVGMMDGVVVEETTIPLGETAIQCGKAATTVPGEVATTRTVTILDGVAGEEGTIPGTQEMGAATVTAWITGAGAPLPLERTAGVPATATTALEATGVTRAVEEITPTTGTGGTPAAEDTTSVGVVGEATTDPRTGTIPATATRGQTTTTMEIDPQEDQDP